MKKNFLFKIWADGTEPFYEMYILYMIGVDRTLKELIVRWCLAVHDEHC